MVPTVLLSNEGSWLRIPEHAPIAVVENAGLTEALRHLAKSHEVDGSWILQPDVGTPYGEVIAAIDAARAAEFTRVVLAGGPA